MVSQDSGQEYTISMENGTPGDSAERGYQGDFQGKQSITKFDKSMRSLPRLR